MPDGLMLDNPNCSSATIGARRARHLQNLYCQGVEWTEAQRVGQFTGSSSATCQCRCRAHPSPPLLCCPAHGRCRTICAKQGCWKRMRFLAPSIAAHAACWCWRQAGSHSSCSGCCTSKTGCLQECLIAKSTRDQHGKLDAKSGAILKND